MARLDKGRALSIKASPLAIRFVCPAAFRHRHCSSAPNCASESRF